VHPDLDDGDLQGTVENVSTVIDRNGGQVTKTDPWGVRRLAYPIQDVREGLYVYMDVEAEPEAIAPIERDLHMMDSVMRHLIIRSE
jgi:small subunit ribosomal protein S6